ncbi:MAG: hypothetical protein IMW89_00440 [Ktedonobacteraceae bacterium]|nr:hypothetical protein [Ktedonobacteraceae bacterium]
MQSTVHYSYEAAQKRSQEAFALSLCAEKEQAQELLLRTQSELKRLSGDVLLASSPGFAGYKHTVEQADRPSLTRTFPEGRAWGWFEMASGVYQLMRERPGSSLVYFKRAWRIWRSWSLSSTNPGDEQILEAKRERTRAGLWLGEAWARFMNERARHAAEAVLRASLAELARLHGNDLLQETLQQQRRLPPALPGTLAYEVAATHGLYLNLLLEKTPWRIGLP